MSASIVMYPAMKDDTSIIASALVTAGKDPSSAIAPRTAGTLITNDISRASSCFTPLASSTVRVVPDLDTPGVSRSPGPVPE